ncbi:uncharacterized protein [Amphiura filiformis]|uniref:uncharacterized protein n=1 Tax=Amphiura filiformis TaxID=82378 RepID=UPI003B226B46
MAAGAQVIPVNLNSRRVLSTTCLCLLTALLISQIGIAFTFVIASVISIALLWYFWTETWFRPSDTRVFATSTGKRESKAGQQEFVQAGQSPENEYNSLPQQHWEKSTDEQTIDLTTNLTRKPLRARRTNAYSDSRFINSGRSNLDTSANIFNSMNKSRRESFISSPRHARTGSGLPGFGNLTFAALAGSSPSKSLISPRENMSFSSSFLYSPNKLSSPNSSMCSTSHRHYPTHQPEYSGLGQLPVVRWNEASSSPVWKRRTSMQSPVMVKIAPPDTVRSESPLVQSMVEEKNQSAEEKANPCTKESVMAAIRECRKRGVEDKDDASSRASTPWEQSHKRRRVDGFSRSSTPSMASSSDYDTAPPSGRASTVGSISSDVLGPKGILSRTPRNAILSSISSSKRVQKRKLSKSDEEDDDETDISPSKKPTLGLDVTSEEPNTEDSDSDLTSKNGNKENRPATPLATPAKKKGRKGDDVEGERDNTPEKSENRTPRKRSLRQLLARQKTPLRGAALYARAATMMSNSPGEYTAADLQEDRHMARQRVSYIKEALQEPEPPPSSTTGPATATSTSTSTAGISLLSNNLTSNPLSNTQAASNTITASPAPSGLLAALSKATSPTTVTSATAKPTLNVTATSGAGPSLGRGLGLSTASTSGISPLTTSKTSQAPSSSTANLSFFSGLSSTNKPAATNVGPTAATSTTNSGPLPPPPSYSMAQTMQKNPGSLPSATLQSTVATAPSLSAFGQQKPVGTPTSSVGLLTQQIKSQDAGSAPNLSTAFQMSKSQAAPATSAFTNSQTSSPFNFNAASTKSNTLNTNSTSTTMTSGIFSAPSSTAPSSSSLFNTSTLGSQKTSTSNASNPQFKPLFPAAANTTSAQQTSTFNFSAKTAATPSTAPSSNFNPMFNTQTTSSGFGNSNPTTAPGGFPFNPSTTSNNNQAKTSTPFQFGSVSSQASTASTTASQASSNIFSFGAQKTQANPSPFGGTSTSGQTNPSPFGATSSAGQTQTSVFGQSSNTSQAQNQTNMFGGAAKPAFVSQPNASPFGSVASSSTTTTTQNPFGATAPQTQNMFGQPQQTASPFGGAPQQQTQNPFGGGTPAQTQNAFGASTQAANSSGVFTFGANNAAKQPAMGGGASSGFNFGAAAQQSTPSGFNFSAAAAPNPNTGFNFGQNQQQQQQQQQSQPSSGFQFGQQTPSQSSQPFGAPANPQPFNFAAGGTGFASAPASGRSTPVGNFSVGTASTGTSTAAQRRARSYDKLEALWQEITDALFRSNWTKMYNFQKRLLVYVNII